MLTHVFTTFVYQPFFNLLVGIYWLINQLPITTHADMGVAVIIFTVALRIIMLPLTLSGQRSIKEHREIEAKVAEIHEKYSADPIQERINIRKVLKTNGRIVVAELFAIGIQIAIALMLWRIFAKGLLGEDFHFMYGFMPQIEMPLDLTFMDKYDLTHPSWTLNIVQSFIIFVVETMNVLTSPYPITRKEAMRMQIVMPAASFLIFALLPAGKKLFVITTLLFTIVFMSVSFIRKKLAGFLTKPV